MWLKLSMIMVSLAPVRWLVVKNQLNGGVLERDRGDINKRGMVVTGQLSLRRSSGVSCAIA